MRSRACRHPACSPAAICAASAAVRYPIAARSMPSASAVVAGGGTALTWLTSSRASHGLMTGVLTAPTPAVGRVLITCSMLLPATDIPGTPCRVDPASGVHAASQGAGADRAGLGYPEAIR